MLLCIYHVTDGKRHYSFNKYLLGGYSVPVTMAGVEESESKKGKPHFSVELPTYKGRMYRACWGAQSSASGKPGRISREDI